MTLRATPHSFAKYNYQILVTFPGGTIIPFLWSRPSADVIDLTLQRLLTTQMHSPTMPSLPPEAKQKENAFKDCPGIPLETFLNHGPIG